MHLLRTLRTSATVWFVIVIWAAPGLAEPAPQAASDSGDATGDRWIQSYDAGYIDDNGVYAGGSEIMHLVSHRGKLYAANGYWMDARWVIPPAEQKQSSQVLRLDSPRGTWQVDLDLGKSNGLGLRYMKGNILKSVTFHRDASGRPLPKPQNLLVMASGANFEKGGAVSAWVRDDSNGTWHDTLVRHGSNTGGVRWVPRDMEVYVDKVTGIERLFLLLGNPGIISGVYDPTAEVKLRWDRNTEFPFLSRGHLDVRPLGLVTANDSLFFSVGASIYRRNDGVRPTYTEVLNLVDDADTDVGGIRGLTAIANPQGPGQSLLFLWAPGGRSRSQVVRLDPKDSGGFSVQHEASMMDLMKKTLGVDVAYTLGAHNMMYPAVHPQTRETVHIIGFQGNILGKDHLRWKGSRLYAGAMYAIRSADQKYTVHEVNNSYTPGKAILVSPRTFCVSPFGDHELYIAGHDSSNKISDDMAWVFRAPLEVALGVRPGQDAAPPRPAPAPAARLTKGPVYELRIYSANLGRHRHLIKRFREHTDRIFKKHNMQPVGYWLPLDAKAHKRKFIYILKHPSRYAAYQNWIRFSADREWRAVLDKPEFQRLLAAKPESVFLTANDPSADFPHADTVSGGAYELRTCITKPGMLSQFKTRFLGDTTRIMNKHGMKVLASWTPFDQPASSNTLISLVHHASREQADLNWRAFGSDPQRQKVNGESQSDGGLLASPPNRIYLKAMDFSPLR